VVQRVYNLAPDSAPVGVLVDDDWVVMLGGFIYIGDGDPIALTPPLISARALEDGTLAISNVSETLYAFKDGRLIERVNEGAPGPSQARALPEPIEAKVLTRYSGGGMPATRVLLDIHTGRFFGAIGPWVMGLSALFLCLLSISGLVLWARPYARRRG
jgi:hypothetical protein